MRSQAGRPWRKVHKDMLVLFDTRTLAGRHIVFDHMSPKNRLDEAGCWRISRTRFRIDAHGVLRIAPPLVWMFSLRQMEPSQWHVDAALHWSRGRCIRERGKHVYWLEPTDPSAEPRARRYRQGKALTLEERAQVRELPELWPEVLVEVNNCRHSVGPRRRSQDHASREACPVPRSLNDHELSPSARGTRALDTVPHAARLECARRAPAIGRHGALLGARLLRRVQRTMSVYVRARPGQRQHRGPGRRHPAHTSSWHACCVVSAHAPKARHRERVLF
jgi:hypothetical protein